MCLFKLLIDRLETFRIDLKFADWCKCERNTGGRTVTVQQKAAVRAVHTDDAYWWCILLCEQQLTVTFDTSRCFSQIISYLCINLWKEITQKMLWNKKYKTYLEYDGTVLQCSTHCSTLQVTACICAVRNVLYTETELNRIYSAIISFVREKSYLWCCVMRTCW